MPETPQVAYVDVRGQRWRVMYMAEEAPVFREPGDLHEHDSDTGEGGEPQVCIDTRGMSDDQKAQIMIDFFSGQMLLEVYGKEDQAKEYGALIYRGSDGFLYHTPLRSNGDFRADLSVSFLPIKNGTPDWSVVVGVFHSHPQFLMEPGHTTPTDWYRPNQPDLLLYPSNDYVFQNQTIGDWITTDSIRANILHDGGNPDIAIFIAGYRVDAGPGGLLLHRYSHADKGGTVPKNPIDPNALPPCNT